MQTTCDSLQALRKQARQELTGDILPFWAQRAFDAKGRLTGVVSHDLRSFDEVPRHAVLCARLLWTFAAAQRVEPSEQWLDAGRKALACLSRDFVDKVNGGVFWSLRPDGSVLSSRKQIYAQAFAIYGLSEWFLATGDSQALELAKTLFRLVEKHATEPTQGGYIEALAEDWQPLEDMRLSDKDLNAPKSMNTLLHVLEAYTLLLKAWPDKGLAASLQALLRVMLDRVVTEKPFVRCALFFDNNWRSLNEVISYGHDIEASWLLWEAALAVDDPALCERVKTIAVAMADGVLHHGLDKDGAVFYSGTAEGVLDHNKHWWPQAEAVVGFLNAHALSGRKDFLQAALNAWSFIETRVVDSVHGEWFAVLDRAGVPLADYPAVPDSCKIGPWKCPYHNARACLEIMRRVEVAGRLS